MKQRPEEMTLKELKPFMSEYVRRTRLGKVARPPSLAPCIGCGTMLNATERRAACATCGESNRKYSVAQLRRANAQRVKEAFDKVTRKT